MESSSKAPGSLSGILEKRRQNLKFHWKVYNFVLEGSALSYYKLRGNNEKEGELWGTIELRDVQCLNSTDAIGHRYPIEVTLRSGKVILLSADCNMERMKWLQALQDKMMELRSRRSSDTPVVRERPGEYSRGICDWMTQSNPSDTSGITGGKEGDIADLDSFIDQTFDGITFNRQSKFIKKEANGEQRDPGNTT
ncbi:hypothetical protein XENTR_v10023760 [Xenopus tropicalis]|uniref:Uncharacterized protein LOC100488701 n=1 Tax=Xenopus tropicalis TaxID=8364 RepID=A0A8J0QUD4_XENTR|nr:uncharacterized protein LOC100488701 [Xenopus tropicalis]XP_031749495.1 uncharacterized protein LOC100488701 [Xenopus tropicalis]KAE8578755.1 hypothetical protein XENTR_v10023760 [Xenopus tropicalis]